MDRFADSTIAILAGGMSRRMGRDKALIPDSKGIPWVVRIARATVADRILILTGEALKFEALSFPSNALLLADTAPNRGPMGGIQTALQHCDTSWLYVLTCDMPSVSAEDLRGLGLPDSETDAHFTAQSYFPLVVRNSANVLAQTDQKSVKTFLDSLRSRPISASIRNCNRESDLSEIVR
jgi:molybdopterin-guanine dinucleotide biosynthesis protein A